MRPDLVDADPGAAAELAAEALRAVNRLTITAPAHGMPGWEDVGDIYRVLGGLHILVQRLPQAMGQLARHLQPPGAVDECYRVDGATTDSAEVLVEQAIVALDFARVCAVQMEVALASAHSDVSHLAPRDPAMPSETAS